MGKIATCLWFDGKAEEAVRFYAAVFPGATISDVMRRTDSGPAGEGSVLALTLQLDGQEIIALNGGPMFQFTPAMSLFVKCETQSEVDTYWGRLLEGGTAQRCGWLTDQFGVTWQIVPTELRRLLSDPDAQRAGRVMAAMMGMVKLDIAALRTAYAGG